MHVSWKTAPFVFAIFFSQAFAQADYLAVQTDVKISRDHYVNRTSFINAAMAICRSIRSSQWTLNPGVNLNPAFVNYIEQVTGMKATESKVVPREANELYPSFRVSLEKDSNHYSFSFYMTENHASISLGHPRYLLEDIARVIMDPSCAHYRSKLAFFNSKEKLVLRQFLDEKAQVKKNIVTKEEVASIAEAAKLSPEQLQKIQDQQIITVAVIDQGVDYNHPKLAAKMRPNQKRLDTLKGIKQSVTKNQLNFGWWERLILKFTNPEWFTTYEANSKFIEKRVDESLQDEQEVGKDLVEKDNLPYDYATAISTEVAENKNAKASFNHGTHVADVASRYNEIKLLPIRIGNNSDLAGDAVEYASRRSSRVVNLSMGSDKATDWTSFETAVKKHPEILFVVAAGNETQDIDLQPTYPAAFSLPNMIVVASVDRHGDLSWFSNYGATRVHIAAYGEEVLAAVPQRQTGIKSGTSMATPQVSRVAAEMMAINPELTPTEVIKILLETSVSNFSTRGKIHAGVMNEKKALAVATKLIKPQPTAKR